MAGEESGKSGGAAPMPLPPRPRSLDAERFALEAEKLQLEAEKLRLEAERGKLLLEEERLQRKGMLQQKQDKLIFLFRDAFYGSSSNAESTEGDKAALAEAVRVRLSTINAALFLRLADMAETEEAPTERERLWALSEELMRSVTAADASIGERLSEELRESVRRAGLVKPMAAAAATAAAIGADPSATSGSGPGLINAGEAAKPPSQRELVERWMKATMAGSNSSVQGMPNVMDLSQLANGSVVMGSGGGQVMLLPLWVPMSLLRHVSSAPPLRDEDVDAVKEQVFGMETFYVTGVEKSSVAVLFRGNLRGDSDVMFDQVTAKLEGMPGGLGERVQLFLMRDPSPAAPDQMDRGADSRPVFILISRETEQSRQASVVASLAAAAAFATTCFTAFAYSIGTFALNSDFFKKITEGDVAVASKALPVAAGVILLQLLHELSHAAVAKQNGLKLGAPIFIPSLQVGSFGAITPFLSFPKSRKVMFDVAAAGPLIASIASIAALIAGLVMTGMAPQDAISAFPVVPAGLFHSSLLVGAVMSAALPSVMAQALTTPIPIHPLAIIGITGIIVNALNLMPIGRLDGGRAATAVFGRRTAAVVGTATLLLQAVSAIFNNYSLQLFWGLVVILFQRVQDLPALDEVTGVDEKRTSLMLGLTLFALLALLPFPNVL